MAKDISADMTLEQHLQDLVDEAGDVTVVESASGREYRRGGRPFAVDEAGAVELRLGPDIAEAAMRTPDSGPSSRGEDWVRVAPHEWDDHALDRLEAWFRVAWRFAGESRSR